ncbi:MAG: energy transducer TonB [Acidobacteria bacterium]|nr:energy transducer TonB [Acidobacteriota bacterium]
MIAEAGFATGSASRSEDFAPRRGIVASAGFAASSVPGQRARAPGAPVRQVGFSYAPAAAEKRTTPVRDAGFNVAIESAEKRRPAAAAQAAFEPVEILSKPRPAYTAEARAARIEGAVELEILFGASGELRVLRVVRGLGSGLNESAIEAARQIRFKPATRDGVPADFTALVQVIFQMVY